MAWSGLLRSDSGRRQRGVPARAPPIPAAVRADRARARTICDLLARLFIAPLDAAGNPGPESRPRAARRGRATSSRQTGDQYHLNLDTSSMAVGRWQLRVDLGDGEPHPTTITLTLRRMAAPDESALATTSGARTVREAGRAPRRGRGAAPDRHGGEHLLDAPAAGGGGGVDRARRRRRRPHRRRERLAPPRAAARRGGAGDRGHGQHERHPPAREPAAARTARAGAAGRGDLDRVGDADDPAATAHLARAPVADARLLRGTAGGGVRQGVVVGAGVRGAAAARRARDVARGGRRDGFAARAAGRRAGVVRPG